MTPAPGDLLEVPLKGGVAYGVVALCPAAYPPAIAFAARLFEAPIDDPGGHLSGPTVVALVPLPAEARVRARGLSVPSVRFQVPVRDRTGRVLYAWEWDGSRIMVGSEASLRLPERRVIGPDDLASLLRRDRAGEPPS